MLRRTATLYKTSFTGLSPQTWLLSTVILINRSGTMVVPFMTLYLTSPQMGRSLSDAGTVMGLFGLGAIIGAYFGGKFSDKIGFQKVQLVTLFGGGIMFIVLGQIKSFPLICLFTFLLSLVNEAFRPANSSAIAHYSKPENRTRSYSLNRLAINLGWAFGTSIGGIIASYNYELLFWVDGITNICAAFALFFFLRTGKEIKAGKEENEVKVVKNSVYKDKTYLLFIFYLTLFAICFFQLFTTIPKYFRDDLHLSEQYIGLIMAMNGLLIVMIEMILVYRLEGQRPNLTYITWGVIICAFAFFSLLIPGNGKLITLIMILVITLGEVVAMPFMASFWSSRSDDNNRGQYASLFTIAWGLGQTLGPYLSSHLVEATNFNVLFITIGTLLLIASLGFHSLKKRDI
jgi:predicted MFS family arabinose efflux permease